MIHSLFSHIWIAPINQSINQPKQTRTFDLEVGFFLNSYWRGLKNLQKTCHPPKPKISKARLTYVTVSIPIACMEGKYKVRMQTATWADFFVALLLNSWPQQIFRWCCTFYVGIHMLSHDLQPIPLHIGRDLLCQVLVLIERCDTFLKSYIVNYKSTYWMLYKDDILQKIEHISEYCIFVGLL